MLCIKIWRANMNANIKVVVTGELFDESGNVKQKFVKHNLITQSGYDFLANCFGNSTRPSPMKYIAVGTGTTAPTLKDTKLKSEIIRKAGDFSHGADTTFITLGITLLPGEGTGALTEAGIFNADNVLFDRLTFPVINKGALDTYRISFNVYFEEQGS